MVGNRGQSRVLTRLMEPGSKEGSWGPVDFFDLLPRSAASQHLLLLTELLRPVLWGAADLQWLSVLQLTRLPPTACDAESVTPSEVFLAFDRKERLSKGQILQT